MFKIDECIFEISENVTPENLTDVWKKVKWIKGDVALNAFSTTFISCLLSCISIYWFVELAVKLKIF